MLTYKPDGGTLDTKYPKRSLPKINPGDRVPHTGLFRLDKGTRIIPVNKLGKRDSKRSTRR